MNSKLLLVDDDSHVTDALKRAMRHEPYEILTADSAENALEIMAAEDIDVVISDEKMSGMPGSEFFALASKKYPGTVRILLTGQANIEVAMRAINEGQVHRFFTKPWNHVDLAITIRQALEQRKLTAENQILSEEVKTQSLVLQQLEEKHPGITKVERDSSGAIIIDDIDEVEEYMGSLSNVKNK